jgi:hypothetical protein
MISLGCRGLRFKDKSLAGVKGLLDFAGGRNVFGKFYEIAVLQEFL